MTLPLETINGKQYQPVENVNNYDDCENCVFEGKCEDFDSQVNCVATAANGRVAVYFIEPGDTNEQEKIKQES